LTFDFGLIFRILRSETKLDSVSVTRLKKYYGRVKAVDGITFTVGQGEVFGMLGPNGAGKTTTVETIIGLTKRDGGEIQVLGIDPAKDPGGVKSRIGVQLQTAAMFPRLTVKETIQLYSDFYPRSLGVTQAMELVGLQDKANVQTIKLSGGQLQRLSVALALTGDNDLIFLDEPTTGLDPQARHSLWEVICKMRGQGKTVFMTTHYMDEAEKLCDRVAVVDQGKIIALDSPQELIRQHFKEKAIEFHRPEWFNQGVFNGLPGIKRVQTEEDSVILYSAEVSKSIPALLRYSEETGEPLNDFSVRTATLEDVFLELTGRRLRE
jgi:ABC-2 type transport system ATP-binding protein